MSHQVKAEVTVLFGPNTPLNAVLRGRVILAKVSDWLIVKGAVASAYCNGLIGPYHNLVMYQLMCMCDYDSIIS